MDNTSIKQFMLQLSAEAGRYLRNNFYTLKNVFAKDAGGVATNVDVKLEETLVRRIRHAFPGHGIIMLDGESTNADAEFLWIVDALDGASHFSRNIPVYATTLALQQSGETALAAVNHPETRQLFFAEKGVGAQLNGIDIRVSETREFSEAYVYVELPEQKFRGQEDVSARISERMKTLASLIARCKQVETFRIGAYGQCLVAAGAFDAYVDLSGSSKAAAQAASHLIVREAGGSIVNLDEPAGGFVRVAATNKLLAGALRETL